MSVYPKRLLPGEPVFLHVRVPCRRPRRPMMRILLEHPGGDTVLVHAFQPLVLPMVPETPGEEAPPTHGLRRTSPVYLAARHLVGADGDSDAMVEIIRTTQQSVHFHHALDTGADWALGRYRIHLEMRSDGRVRGSDTAREAWFALERLSLQSVGRSGDTGTAVVRNHGPLPVPARVCGLGRGEMWSRDVRLPPGDTELAFRGRPAWLLYSDDRQSLLLGDARSPHSLRNEALAWSDRPDTGTVLVHGARTDAPGWTLEGKARDLWLRADGLVQRDELRTAEDARAYDELHAQGLILEIPASTGAGA